MVSVCPNPPPGQDFTHLYCFYSGGGGDMMRNGVNTNLPETSSGWHASLGMEDTNKKIRKPYTITKSRESWSEQEHDKFLEALQLFDRDWKKIEAFVGSKTVIQSPLLFRVEFTCSIMAPLYENIWHIELIRSHAQKYFMKVLKNGKSEHVPPPRPKRKAAHPYPQKAPKNGVLQSSGVQLESGYALRPESVCVNRNPVGSVHSSPWTSTDHVSHMSKDDNGLAGGTMMQYYSHNRNESNPQLQRSNETNCQEKAKQCTATKVMPDFAQVYSFLGSVFDHSASDHLQRLKKMDPINVGTVLMLMKNLSINLASPEFEDHRRLLSSYDVGSENDSTGSTIQSA